MRFLNPVSPPSFTVTGQTWHAFTLGSGPALPEPGSLAFVGAAPRGLGAGRP